MCPIVTRIKGRCTHMIDTRTIGYKPGPHCPACLYVYVADTILQRDCSNCDMAASKAAGDRINAEIAAAALEAKKKKEDKA